ncbi:MAG: SMI1/KNR4 family protein [Lachnospiraceae bacterium]
MNYLDEVIKNIQGRVSGCSDDQIEQLRFMTNNQKLPMAYEEFMKIMGNGATGYMTGESIYMDEVFTLKESAVNLLIENDSKNILTEDDYVFWMCQGCMFCFFKLGEGENPPIYCYRETGDDCFFKIANSFTEFLMNKLKNNPMTFGSADI